MRNINAQWNFTSFGFLEASKSEVLWPLTIQQGSNSLERRHRRTNALRRVLERVTYEHVNAEASLFGGSRADLLS